MTVIDKMTPDEYALYSAINHADDEWTPEARTELERIKADAWDQGFNQATFEFVDSDYCGTKHQCGSIMGTRNDEKNPYRHAD